MEATITAELLLHQKHSELSQMGRNVIEQEAQALLALAARVNHQFAAACELLLACKGRIIVTGIGKSGHIGRKIVATFASTGSPAFFLHPAEAKHGDAGVMTSNDVLIALSYSGESEEVLAILPLARHLAIPVIALTGNPHSTLTKAACLHLDVSVEKEACDLGLAPTSSTTVTLAMGDALAMTVSKERKFTVEQFALSHPGGMLGRRLLLKVDDIMHRDADMPLVNIHATLTTALMEMTHKRLGMTIVEDEQHYLAGVFTDGDLRRILNKNGDIRTMLMGDIMNRQPKILTLGSLVTEAMNKMKEFKITALIIVDNNKPMGVVHMHDILRVGIA